MIPHLSLERLYIIYHYILSATKFLPLYSPDLSPIELCWSKLKEIFRSAKTRTWDALDEAITMAVDVVLLLLMTMLSINLIIVVGFLSLFRELRVVAGFVQCLIK